MALPLPFARETSAHLPGSSVLQEAVANYLNGGDWRIVGENYTVSAFLGREYDLWLL
jgi:hypothetical protein